MCLCVNSLFLKLTFLSFLMKKTILLILTFIFININICIAQINGHLTDRLEKSLIKEYFPNYNNTNLNVIDNRILEIKINNTLLGYIFSTWDMVKSLGYDRQPYEIIVGLNTNGTLAGATLTYHNEPLFVHDISEEYLEEFVKNSKGLDVSIGLPRVSRGQPLRADTLHRGTISSNLMHEALFKSARSAAISANLYGVKTGERINYLKQENLSWERLIKKKYVVTQRILLNEAKAKLINLGLSDNIDDLPNLKELPNKEKIFLDIAVGLNNPRSIGYNILGEWRHDKIMSTLDAKDHAIVIAGNGYSFKGSDWRRTKKFERIRVIQGNNIITFKSTDQIRLSKINSKNAPKFKEIGLFRISPDKNFNPIEPWYLEIIYFNDEKSSEKIIIPYILSQELIIKPNEELSMWTNVWLGDKFRISILIASLLILTLITIFQDKLSKNRKIFRFIRISYLSFTLIWIGWYAGAQLSIFNILSLARIPLTGVDLNYFLIDPLIFIILCFTIVSTLILGRGLFCGWLCPFGALQDLIGWISKVIGITKKEIPEKYYTKLWSLKYFILLIILGTSFISMDTASQLAEIEPFKTAIMKHFNRGIPYLTYAVILLVISIFMERSFCRFLCPLGASIAIIGKFRIINHLKRRSECGNPCNLCSTSCPVKAIPTNSINKGKIIMSECFRCLDCQLEYVDNKRCPPLVRLQKQKLV